MCFCCVGVFLTSREKITPELTETAIKCLHFPSQMRFDEVIHFISKGHAFEAREWNRRNQV